jgi:hypothetical protein
MQLAAAPRMKNFVAALVCALSTGCAGAAWDKTEVGAPPVAMADGTRWEQYCTFNGATDLATINAFLHEQGERGWELVSVGGQTATVYCFKARVARGGATMEQ